MVGCQWGDEGKGKFTDLLSGAAHAVVRYQAGPQTGHTVVIDREEFRFNQVPAGVLRGAIGVLGNGCVVDPSRLLEEVDQLRARGVQAELRVSETAHAIMPYHVVQDEVMERWRGSAPATTAETGLSTGQGQIGSTKKGAGPCREDKIARIGIRMVDLRDRDLLSRRLKRLVPLKRDLIEKVFGVSLESLEVDFDVDRMVEQYHGYGRRLHESICDVSEFLAEARLRGRRILYEGSQSLGLDIEQGTYPYVSTGNVSASGVGIGTGRPPNGEIEVIGVAKAYTARVGGGPMPTEVFGEMADRIVQRGKEFGTITGRRRRVGWLDLCLLRKAVRIDGMRQLCLTNIDVLAGLPEVRVATHYLVGGLRSDEYPASLRSVETLVPVYETLEGWPEADWGKVVEDGMAGLPSGARRYVDFIIRSLDVNLAAVSVGPDRRQTLLGDMPWLVH